MLKFAEYRIAMSRKTFLTKRVSAKKFSRPYSGSLFKYTTILLDLHTIFVYILHCTCQIIEARKEPENCEKSFCFYDKVYFIRYRVCSFSACYSEIILGGRAVRVAATIVYQSFQNQQKC